QTLCGTTPESVVPCVCNTAKKFVREGTMIDKLNRALLTGTLTRRKAIAGTSIALAGLAVNSGAAWAGSGEEISRTDESIHQEPVFIANRQRLFDALTDTHQFDK